MSEEQATIVIPKVRQGSDVRMTLTLTDNGVAVDWTSLSDIVAMLYSNEQRVLTGRCTTAIDPEDATKLVCDYDADQPEFLGLTSIVIRCTYLERTKTFDKKVLEFVASTEDLDGEDITLEDPELDVTINVEDVSTSLLDNAIAAAFDGGDFAMEKGQYAKDQGDYAKDKGDYAKDQGDYAKDQGDYAKDQGDYAKNKGDYAKEKGDYALEQGGIAAGAAALAVEKAGLANDAATLANQKAGLANDAATLANTKAGLADDAATLANTKAGLANDAATLANQKAGYAGDQGDYAKAQGDYAKEKGDAFAALIVDNLTTNDPAKALSAKQGKVLNDNLSQLGQEKVKVNAHKNLYDANTAVLGKYINSGGGLSNNASFFVSSFIPVKSETQYYISRGTVDGTIGTAASYFAEYDSSFNHVALTAATNKTITTNSATRFLRISGFVDYKNSAMVSEGSSFVAFEQYSPINYPVFLDQIAGVDMDKVLSTPTMFKDFPGAGSSLVTRRVYLVPGRVYNLFFNNNEWLDSEAPSNTAKFYVEKWINGVYTTIVNYQKGADVPKVISFEAETADYYSIGIRANSGTTVSVYILDVTEYDSMLPKSLHIKGDNTGVRTAVLKTQIGHNYRLFFLKPNWSKENIGSRNYLSLNDGNGVNVFAYGKTYYPDGFQYRDFLATTETYTLSICADASEYVDVIFADMTEICDNSVTAFNGGYSNLLAIFSTLRRKSYGNTSPARFNLIFYSDIHNGAENNQRIADFKHLFDEYLDDVIHGGDSVQDNFSHTNTVAEYGGQSFLNVIGNHDALLSDGGLATGLQCYDKYISPNVAQWGDVVLPEDAATNGYCYYYKDYTAAKVRLIAVDCMHWDTTQKDWFIATLADAKTNGFSVICVSHYCPDRFPTMISDCTFCTLYSSDVNAGLNSEAEDAVADAITNGLDFICWLFGHTHRDYFVKSHNHPEQYAIGVDKGYGNLASDDSARTKETKFYDSFDIISVDTKAGMLSVIKIGVNADRLMRQKNYLVFDYKNRQIISNS